MHPAKEILLSTEKVGRQMKEEIEESRERNTFSHTHTHLVVLKIAAFFCLSSDFFGKYGPLSNLLNYLFLFFIQPVQIYSMCSLSLETHLPLRRWCVHTHVCVFLICLSQCFWLDNQFFLCLWERPD